MIKNNNTEQAITYLIDTNTSFIVSLRPTVDSCITDDILRILFISENTQNIRELQQGKITALQVSKRKRKANRIHQMDLFTGERNHNSDQLGHKLVHQAGKSLSFFTLNSKLGETQKLSEN
jgi:hypothetical protein